MSGCVACFRLRSMPRWIGRSRRSSHQRVPDRCVDVFAFRGARVPAPRTRAARTKNRARADLTSPGPGRPRDAAPRPGRPAAAPRLPGGPAATRHTWGKHKPHTHKPASDNFQNIEKFSGRVWGLVGPPRAPGWPETDSPRKMIASSGVGTQIRALGTRFVAIFRF